MSFTAHFRRLVSIVILAALTWTPIAHAESTGRAGESRAAGLDKRVVMHAKEIGGVWIVGDGRWKVDGSGGCYFEPNDSGPDQCTAGTSGGATGRWKSNGVGGCYWDSTDPGPNQCNPDPPPNPSGPATEEPIHVTASSGHVTLTPVEIDGSAATIDFRMEYYDNRGGYIAANVTSRRDDLLNVTVRDVELVGPTGPTYRPIRRGPLHRHNDVACDDTPGQNRAFADEFRGIVKSVVITAVASSVGCALTTVGYFACVGVAVGGRIAGEAIWAAGSYLWDCY